MHLPKLDNSSLWDKTYTILKDRIIRRDFKPNQKLSIPELATQLGISRTPIRDALNRLEMDGLVKTVSKVGTFVNAIEAEDVLDIMDTRLMLELWVVETLKNLSAQELAKIAGSLEAILDKASVALDKASLDAYLKSGHNLQFHMQFIQLGNNKKNAEIYLNIMHYHVWATEYSLFTKEMVTTALEQHYSIVRALKHGDFEAVKTSIRLHLEDSKERLIKRLQENGGQI